MIKGHTDLETLSKAETMVFGKTKVVTEGRYEILEAFPNGMPEEQMLSYAAAAELNSSHPIARAIVGAGRRDVSERFAVIEMDEIPGRGVSAFVDGKHVYVGNAELLKDHGIDYLIPSRPGSAIHVAVDNHYAGHILVYDKIKDGAFEAVDELRVNGVKTSVMLTGDVRSTARSVALTLNFDMVKPELSPDAKASAVEYLMATRNINTTLAYVGDGISDIKALNRASVGITVGVFDAPEALDNADIAIMGRDLRKLAGLYRLAKLSYRVCRIDTLVMCIAKAAVLCLGAAGILTVGWAVMLSTAATLAALVYSFSPELFR